MKKSFLSFTLIASISSVFSADFRSQVLINNNYESRFCEFYVDSIHVEHTSHYGVPEDKIISVINVLSHDGKLLRVGQWISYTSSNEVGLNETYSYGDYERAIEFPTIFVDNETRKTVYRQVKQFAYFIDVQRPDGEIARLWQSNSGANYVLDEVMSYPTYNVVIPYGKKEYSNENTSLFSSKHQCKK